MTEGPVVILRSPTIHLGYEEELVVRPLIHLRVHSVQFSRVYTVNSSPCSIIGLTMWIGPVGRLPSPDTQTLSVEGGAAAGGP